MWERIKSATTVCIITGLIWWSADRRVTDEKEFTVRLTVSSADASLLATIESPRSGEAVVRASGTRARLDAFENELNRNPALAFEYVLSENDTALGPKTLSTARMLAESRRFRDAGLDVADVRPSEVQIVVDRYEDVDLRIEPDFGSIGVEDVVCQPQTVLVRKMPGTLARTRYAERVLRPSAERAVQQWLAAHPDNPRFEVDVTLSIPDAPVVLEISPSPHVKIAGRFVNPVASARVGPCQIVFAVPPDVQRDYVVQPAASSNLRPDVFVRGPKNQVEQLTPQQIVLYVPVLAADTATTASVRTIRRAPEIVLPGGLELDRDLQEVEFELVPRTSVPSVDEPLTP
ncbi:MAG: hypothetical protein L6Q92_08310 [Phycisphaerae bacterium]|nr:hypothetical protein [Phycisphaerae bacterium]